MAVYNRVCIWSPLCHTYCGCIERQRFLDSNFANSSVAEAGCDSQFTYLCTHQSCWKCRAGNLCHYSPPLQSASFLLISLIFPRRQQPPSPSPPTSFLPFEFLIFIYILYSYILVICFSEKFPWNLSFVSFVKLYQGVPIPSNLSCFLFIPEQINGRTGGLRPRVDTSSTFFSSSCSCES